jgi:hypothetical protein
VRRPFFLIEYRRGGLTPGRPSFFLCCAIQLMLADAYSATWYFLASPLIEHPLYLGIKKTNSTYCKCDYATSN